MIASAMLRVHRNDSLNGPIGMNHRKWRSPSCPIVQIFSTVYSVLRNPANSLSPEQWTGCGLVFLGLLIEILEKAFKKAPTTDAKKKA